MLRTLLILTLCLGALLITSGCVSPASPPAELTRTGWTLVAYNDGNEIINPAPLTIITLAFGDDGRISGNAGCNDFFGTYRTEGGLITISVLGSTERYCLAPGGVMETEQRYLFLLGNTTRYSIDGDKLTLSHYDIQKLLEFRRQ